MVNISTTIPHSQMLLIFSKASADMAFLRATWLKNSLKKLDTNLKLKKPVYWEVEYQIRLQKAPIFQNIIIARKQYITD